MSKQLLSKTQQRINNSVKNIESFDLPIDPTISSHFETKEEWLEEMQQEEAQMTLKQKQQAEQQGQAQLERMRKLHPEKFKGRNL